MAGAGPEHQDVRACADGEQPADGLGVVIQRGVPVDQARVRPVPPDEGDHLRGVAGDRADHVSVLAEDGGKRVQEHYVAVAEHQSGHAVTRPSRRASLWLAQRPGGPGVCRMPWRAEGVAPRGCCAPVPPSRHATCRTKPSCPCPPTPPVAARRQVSSFQIGFVKNRGRPSPNMHPNRKECFRSANFRVNQPHVVKTPSYQRSFTAGYGNAKILISCNQREQGDSTPP